MGKNNGVGGMEFAHHDFDPREINRQVKKTLKKEREKDSSGSQMEVFSDALVLSALGQSQQAYINIVTQPPVSAAGTPITAVDAGPNFTANNAALLKYAVNGVVNLAVADYNAVNALRAETFLALFDHGLNPRKKRSGLFGGGIGGLLFLSMAGGSANFNLFGGSGGIVRSQNGYGGILG